MEVQGDIFVEVIIYSKGHIIGFALIEIFKPNPDLYTGTFSSRMLSSGYFPKIIGQFQNVTEEYIQERFERAKK